MIKILVDAMGGDNAPQATVAGACLAAEKDKELYIILTGRKDEVQTELNKHKYDKSRFEIVDCPDVVDMNDIPTEAVRKKDSSLIRGFWMLKKEEDICALVTAGSTGATIAGGQLILGRIRGVKRPALCAGIPNSRGGVTLLCDCGANAECKIEMLCQFAILASAYAKAGFGIQNPRIGLLNNGTEEHKGDPLRQQTYQCLKQLNGINFAGNAEGRDIMLGDFDAVIADGFSGNVALKSMEGCGKLVLGVMKKEFSSSLSSKIGYLFMRKAIKRMRGQLDFDKAGGALLVGLKKPVIKSHGSSKPETIAASIANAATVHRNALIPAIDKLLEESGIDRLSEIINVGE
ncbi:MAG: phosphate acyltransferase PlsX [Clostridia bacterium]|nr:phosphate acyltransferase PlsX [Clostridia bacterium]